MIMKLDNGSIRYNAWCIVGIQVMVSRLCLHKIELLESGTHYTKLQELQKNKFHNFTLAIYLVLTLLQSSDAALLCFLIISIKPILLSFGGLRGTWRQSANTIYCWRLKQLYPVISFSAANTNLIQRGEHMAKMLRAVYIFPILL